MIRANQLKWPLKPGSRYPGHLSCAFSAGRGRVRRVWRWGQQAELRDYGANDPPPAFFHPVEQVHRPDDRLEIRYMVGGRRGLISVILSQKDAVIMVVFFHSALLQEVVLGIIPDYALLLFVHLAVWHLAFEKPFDCKESQKSVPHHGETSVSHGGGCPVLRVLFDPARVHRLGQQGKGLLVLSEMDDVGELLHPGSDAFLVCHNLSRPLSASGMPSAYI